MNQTEFFKDQLRKTLEEHMENSIIIDNMKFVISPCNAENEKPKTNWDEIINWWILPAKTNLKLTLDQVIETLCSHQGLLPLWIRIKNQDENLIILNISRRFRKLNDIKLFHNHNETMPFIYDNELTITYSEELERIGLMSKLMWQFELNETERKVFETSPLTYLEIKTFFVNHFEHYIYFPPNYNHREPNSKEYSQLVIKKGEREAFTVYSGIGSNNETEILSSTNFDQILDLYLNVEKGYMIDNLKIEKQTKPIKSQESNTSIIIGFP